MSERESSASRQTTKTTTQDERQKKGRLSSILDDFKTGVNQQTQLDKTLLDDFGKPSTLSQTLDEFKLETIQRTGLREQLDMFKMEAKTPDTIRATYDELTSSVAKKETLSEMVAEIKNAFEPPKRDLFASPQRAPAGPQQLPRRGQQTPPGQEQQQQQRQQQQPNLDQVPYMKEFDNITNDQAQKLSKELFENIMSIGNRRDLSWKQKARQVARTFGIKTGLFVKEVVWSAALRWLQKNSYRIIGHLAAGAAGALLFALLGPLVGASGGLSFAAYMAKTGLAKGLWSFILSALGKGLMNSGLSLGMDLGREFLTTNSYTKGVVNYNLLGASWIQNVMSYINIPEPYRSFTLMDLINSLLSNGLTFVGMRTATEAGGMGLPDDAWNQFGISKALQYLFLYGPAAISVALKSGYKATKALFTVMFQTAFSAGEKAYDLIKAHPSSNIPTQTEQVLNRRLANNTQAPLTTEDVRAAIPAMQEDIKRPEIQEAFGKVYGDTLDTLMRDLDKKTDAQIKKDPPPPVVLNHMRARQPLRKVEAEKTMNLSWLAVNTNTRAAALLSGACIFSMLAARSASPETIASLLPAALGKSAAELAKATAASAQEHLSAELLMYQMVSNVIGVPKFIQKAGQYLPQSVRDRLAKLDEKIGNASKGVATEKHPYVREFFSIIVGRKIYSKTEVERMKKEELVEVLKAAGTEFSTRIPNLLQLKRAVLQLQEQNVKEVHRILFNAMTTQLMGTVGTGAGILGAKLAMNQGKDLVKFIISNDAIASAIGLSNLEKTALGAQVDQPLDQDILQLTVPGTIKDEAKDVARSNGDMWGAAANGMDKIENFLGVPGEITKDIPTRDQYKDAIAQGKGFNTWADYKKDLDLKAGMKERDKSLAEGEKHRQQSRLDQKTRIANDHGFKSWEEYLAWRAQERDRRLAEQPEKDRKEREERKKYQQEVVLPRLEEARAGRMLDNETRRLARWKEHFKNLFEKNELFKDLGFSKYFDQWWDSVQAKGVINLGANDKLNDPTKADQLLDEGLKKALNVEMLPLAYYGVKKAASVTSGGLLSAIPIVGDTVRAYETMKESYNTAVDAYQTVQVTMNIMRAMVKSGAVAQDGVIASLAPENESVMNENIKKLPSLVDYIESNPEIQKMINEQKINLADVVSKAMFKHVIWGTTKSEFFGEIAGVILAGKQAGDAGAATAKGIADAASYTADLLKRFGEAGSFL